MSETDETSTVAGTESSAAAPEPTPAPASAPQTESSPRRSRWASNGVRGGMIAAVIVIVAGAFFTIGWFTSTRGDRGDFSLRQSIDQGMGMRQQGADEWQGHRGHRPGMGVPQQGQSMPWGGQSAPPTQPTQPTQPTPSTPSTQQGYLGVGVQTVSAELQQQYGLSRPSGALVVSIDSSGPASKAGIQRGDVITSVAGTTVTQAEDIVSLIAKTKAGDTVSVVVDRNGQSLTFQVTLAARAPSISG